MTDVAQEEKEVVTKVYRVGAVMLTTEDGVVISGLRYKSINRAKFANRITRHSTQVPEGTKYREGFFVTLAS